MNTQFHFLFADLLRDHAGQAHERRCIDLQYIFRILKNEYIPGERYLGGISENAIPTHPFKSLRVGRPVELTSDKGGLRTFRPLFIYEEPIDDSRIGRNETNRPVIRGQEDDETFYGYYLQKDIKTLPKLPGCRTGNTIIREGETLVEVFVEKRFDPQVLIPEPTKYTNARIIKDPNPVPEVQKVDPVAVNAIHDFPLSHEKAQKLEWKEGDEIVVTLSKPRAFCKDYNRSRPVVLGAMKYDQAKITKSDGALWIEVNHPTEEFVYKTLGDSLSTPDITINHA